MGYIAATGSCAYNGGGHTQIYAGSDAWTNYSLEARVRLANGSNFPGGLRGRVNTATGQSYAVWLYPGTGVIRLFRAAAWNIDTLGLVQLGEAPASITAGVFHTLAVSFEDSTITVKFNGTAVITVTDTALTAGAIASRCRGSGTCRTASARRS